MSATVSVSKGVFAFKKKSSSTPSKKRKHSSSSYKSTPSSFWPNDDVTSKENQNCFQQMWNHLHSKIKSLEKEIHEAVFKDLVSYVCSQTKESEPSSASKISIKSIVSIPTAVLVTGVNMSDRSEVISSVESQLQSGRDKQHVVRLNSMNCYNLKQLITTLVSELVNGSTNLSVNDSMDSTDDEIFVNSSPTKSKSSKIKKTNCNMSALESWYKEKKDVQNIAVILEDFDNFQTSVLQDFIQICSFHSCLPLVFILCVATSPAAITSRLSQPVLACLSVTTFQARPSRSYLSTLLEKVLMDAELCSFHLGGKAFKLLLDVFLYHDLAVNTFVRAVKYCLLDHFLSLDLTVLCCPRDLRQSVIEGLTGQQLENVRKLPSFRNYVDTLPPKEKAPLLLTDTKLKECVTSLCSRLDTFYSRFCVMVRVVHTLAKSLPHAPLGRQVWSVFSLCLNSTCFVECPEFQEAWKILENSSRDELYEPMQSVICILKCRADKQLIKVAEELTDSFQMLADMDETPDCASPSKSRRQSVQLKPSDRFNLKEKLQQLAQEKQSAPNRYQRVRGDLLLTVKDAIRTYICPPSTQPLHEVFFYNDSVELKSKILGQHKASITKALSDPGLYLECECCSDSQSYSSSLPDLSIVYKLYLEYGRLINLYDWMQAFYAIVRGEEGGNDEMLQARFVQAVSELQFLGFIKTTKRKTDHVARLTWGGC